MISGGIVTTRRPARDFGGAVDEDPADGRPHHLRLQVEAVAAGTGQFTAPERGEGAEQHERPVSLGAPRRGVAPPSPARSSCVPGCPGCPLPLSGRGCAGLLATLLARRIVRVGQSSRAATRRVESGTKCLRAGDGFSSLRKRARIWAGSRTVRRVCTWSRGPGRCRSKRRDVPERCRVVGL